MSRVALLIAATVLLSGCFESSSQPIGETGPAEPRSAAPGTAVSVAQLELGRRIYNFRCYYCHGYSGNARTLAATLVTPKPVDFTSMSPDVLGRERMLQSIRSGRPGTAMMSFSSVLKPREIEAVADFIRQEFMLAKRENTRYHTEANGWFDHQRYVAAFPFTSGEIPLDTPWEQLTPQQTEGKRLFMSSCVSCHDRARTSNPEVIWETRPVSYPRNQYSPGDQPALEATGGTNERNRSSLDAMTSASPYLLHDRAPVIAGLSAAERRGEKLFQQNCAFCHAADGTARNWIGSFMEPHPRDLTSSQAMSGMTSTRLKTVIRDGLPGTSMPAWKSVLSEQQVDDVIAYVGRAFHPLAAEK
ncbi:MAG: c-type cytochrome [Pseudomonadota bacterium]